MSTSTAAGNYDYTRLNNPDRVQARDRNNHWVATFAIDAYTVALAGPSCTFTEPDAPGIAVTHATWVRTLPAPFQEPVNEAWLTAARNANANDVPDLLQLAMQYVKDAPPIRDGDLQSAGDAGYGPAKGADLHDYLGVGWDYGPRDRHSG